MRTFRPAPTAISAMLLLCSVITLFLPCATVAAGTDLPSAPSFTVRDIDNRLISTDSLIKRGPLIVDFWATWCTHCIREMKALQGIVEKYGSDRVTVLAVSQDSPAELTKVKQAAKTKKWPFIVVVDNGKSITQKFQANALPALFLVGGDGKIHAMSRGFSPGDETKLDEIIGEMLRAK
jgi:peroxiredoxin